MDSAKTWSEDPMVRIEDALMPVFWLPFDALLSADEEKTAETDRLAPLRSAAELLKTSAERFLKPAGVSVDLAGRQCSEHAGRVLASLVDDIDRARSTVVDLEALRRINARAKEVVRPAVLAALDAYRDAFLTVILESQKKTARLSQRSTDELRSISKQIFLVAINASVEAARLGEHGAGFAHISNEIRALSKSAQSTIEKMSRDGV